MSVYILGLEMPEDGETVTLTICADGLVFEEFKEPGDVFHAVPVPAHGRLSDLDELKERVTKRLYASNHGSMAEAYFAALIDLIDTAPTIIPAEEENGETAERIVTPDAEGEALSQDGIRQASSGGISVR